MVAVDASQQEGSLLFEEIVATSYMTDGIHRWQRS
jgi:hypothetical protein